MEILTEAKALSWQMRQHVSTNKRPPQRTNGEHSDGLIPSSIVATEYVEVDL